MSNILLRQLYTSAEDLFQYLPPVVTLKTAFHSRNSLRARRLINSTNIWLSASTVFSVGIWLPNKQTEKTGEMLFQTVHRSPKRLLSAVQRIVFTGPTAGGSTGGDRSSHSLRGLRAGGRIDYERKLMRECRSLTLFHKQTNLLAVSKLDGNNLRITKKSHLF